MSERGMRYGGYGCKEQYVGGEYSERVEQECERADEEPAEGFVRYAD